AVRIGKIDGNFVVNPPEESLLGESELDLIVAGTEEAILMVEAGANEIPEAEILDALDIAHDAIKKLCAAQRELAEKAGKEKLVFEDVPPNEALIAQIKASHGADLDAATQVVDKLERQDATNAVEEAVVAEYGGDIETEGHAERKAEAKRAFAALEKPHSRPRIAAGKERPQRPAEREIGPISTETTVGPRNHGSAIFTR